MATKSQPDLEDIRERYTHCLQRGFLRPHEVYVVADEAPSVVIQLLDAIEQREDEIGYLRAILSDLIESVDSDFGGSNQDAINRAIAALKAGR